MKTIKGETFTKVEVHVDDTEFIDCIFSDCILAYQGAPYRIDASCKFSQVSFTFGGPALRTAQFMLNFKMVSDLKLLRWRET